MNYALCKCLDDLAMILEGPAVIFNDKEMAVLAMGVNFMINDRTWTYHTVDLDLRGEDYQNLLLSTLAKLTVCREKH